MEQKVFKNLEKQFAEEHLKEIYGEKQDVQDEDFFPYIQSPVTLPASIMWLYNKLNILN